MSKLSNKLFRLALQGLLSALPVALTIFILVWFVSGSENLFGAWIKFVIPDPYYVRGMGIVAGLILLVLLGLLMNFAIARYLILWSERFLERVPLLKTIFGGIRDFTRLISGAGKKTSPQRVVSFEPVAGVTMVGFLTRDDLSDLPANLGGKSHVAVYFPMSYQIGGYTIYVPREKVQPVDWKMEDAAKFIITGGVSGGGVKNPAETLGSSRDP